MENLNPEEDVVNMDEVGKSEDTEIDEDDVSENEDDEIEEVDEETIDEV